MDPYIDSSALDASHPLTPRKLQNLLRANVAHASRTPTMDAWPSKITLQTTDACNLDCPHCQIPRRSVAEDTSHGSVGAGSRGPPAVPNPDRAASDKRRRALPAPLFRELCLQMERHGVLLDLTTNGTLLDDARLDWIAPIARDVKVSFDGAQKDTFPSDSVAARSSTRSAQTFAP